MSSTKIAICGAAGRMGRTIARIVLGAEDLQLVAAEEYSAHPDQGADVGPLIGANSCGVKITANLREAAEKADAVIDFSHADVTLEVAKAAAAAKTALVIGTTGHDAATRAAILDAAKGIAVVWAPNMSVGVNVMFKLVADAAKALGPDYDIEVVEMHHRHKKDAPSGTAVRLGEVLADVTGVSLGEKGVFTRHGMTGAREPGAIGLQTLRGGDVVGEHTVYFAGEGERIEITHRATSREIFARGAVRAARWVAGKPHGLYDMFDVLGLR